jgi:hypothetical protein
MSTDWGIGCRTCRVEGAPRDAYFSGEWNNCRDVESLAKLCRHAALVVAASDALGGLVSFRWWDFDGAAMYDLPDFFRAHVGHVLAPMDEYGTFDDQCHEYTRCGGCGDQHKCVLDAKHDGPCARVKP